MTAGSRGRGPNARHEREGLELWLYRFAFRHSVAYGLSAILLAVTAGFLASFLFRRAQ